MREVGQHYGIPVINVGEEAGINFDTATYFTVDLIHLNPRGGQRYADYVWAKIRSMGWLFSPPVGPTAPAAVAVTGVAITQHGGIRWHSHPVTVCR